MDPEAELEECRKQLKQKREELDTFFKAHYGERNMDDMSRLFNEEDALKKKIPTLEKAADEQKKQVAEAQEKLKQDEAALGRDNKLIKKATRPFNERRGKTPK